MNSAKKHSSTFQLFNFSTLLVALLAAHPASAMETATITSGSDTKQLLGGTIYTVSGDVSVSVGAGKNALEVKHASGDGGNKVVIEIKDGGSLTVTGGDANGRDGAGAGILLPSDMTLYITGKGRLTATGGNAASGGNGRENCRMALRSPRWSAQLTWRPICLPSRNTSIRSSPSFSLRFSRRPAQNVRR